MEPHSVTFQSRSASLAGSLCESIQSFDASCESFVESCPSCAESFQRVDRVVGVEPQQVDVEFMGSFSGRSESLRGRSPSDGTVSSTSTDISDAHPRMLGGLRSEGVAVNRFVTTALLLSRRRRRLTITLSDPDLRRATTSAVLLENFGNIFRSTEGRVTAASASEDEYAKSSPVNNLDFFLSHSWQADWRLKYTALLLYFNVQPALAAAITTGFAVLAFDRTSTPPDLIGAGQSHAEGRAGLQDFRVGNVWACWQPEAKISGSFPLATTLGMIVFVVVMLTWHHLQVLMGRAPKVFLDKVCIHQTDMERKEAGIKAIGAILGNCQQVLVAWDETYFQRLWCAYELSAFKFAHASGVIKVLPVELGGFTVLAIVIGAALNSLPFIYPLCRYGLISKMISAAVLLVGASGCCLLFWLIQHYLHHVRIMGHQMKRFEMRRARCYCCDNDHTNPQTGGKLLCDRKLVYGSIAHWYGAGDGDVGTGLEQFDRLVRGEVRALMRSSMATTWTQLPYPHALAISLPLFLMELDFKSGCDPVYTAFAALTQLVLRTPALIDLSFWIFSFFAPRGDAICRTSSCGGCSRAAAADGDVAAENELPAGPGWLRAIGVGLASTVPIVIVGTLHEHFIMDRSAHWLLRILWLALEVCLVYWQYRYIPKKPSAGMGNTASVTESPKAAENFSGSKARSLPMRERVELELQRMRSGTGVSNC